jgi:glycosyltransferase involved in cell wall biosynthesis
MNNLISVILPVYNGEEYLSEAIESILNQTYTNFEFIIINDGSKDDSLKIIQKYEKKDNRIIVVSRENRGLIATLNEGIKKAKGKYIARMDQDDISLSKRFAKQIELMKGKELDICGCHFYVIDDKNRYLAAKVMSINNNFNKIVLAHYVPFAHGSVMIKKDFLIQNNLQYGQTNYIHAEDYALWTAFANNNAKISNVDEFLFKYRNTEGSMSKHNINYIDALKSAKIYRKKNYEEIFKIAKGYRNKIDTLNDFEKEQLSYFLLKTLLKGDVIFKLKYIRLLPNPYNIINFIRIIFGR